MANNNHTDAVTNFFETTVEKIEGKRSIRSMSIAMQYLKSHVGVLNSLKVNSEDRNEYEAIIRNQN